MIRTLIALAPLAACPLGMAAMMGLPALAHRMKRGHPKADRNGLLGTVDRAAARVH